MVAYKVKHTLRVSTRPGKPGKMRVHLENLEISWNFEKFNKYHGKILKTWKNLVASKNLPLKSDFENPLYNLRLLNNNFLDLLVVKLT